MDPWMRTGCTQILGNPFGPLTVEPVEPRMMSWVSPSTGWPEAVLNRIRMIRMLWQWTNSMSKRKTNQHARTQKCPELEPRKAHVPKASPLPSSQVPDPSIWRKAWEICLWKMVISCGEVWWSHVKFAIDRSHIYHTKLYSYLLGGFNQPLWKIWVRQLGWWLFPIYGKS